MTDYQELIEKLEKQEEELRFLDFTSETALKIGLYIVERANSQKLEIAVDITKNGHQLFHFSCEGTTPDNDQWIIRKSRVVNRFYKSSLHVTTLLLKFGKTMEEKYFVSSFEYAPSGGSFPIIVKNVGVVGTITVSGLAAEEDHNLVVDAIRNYLKS